MAAVPLFGTKFPMSLQYLQGDKQVNATQTTQMLSRTSVEIADKTEAGNTIRDILAACDSLNKLHETLRRLDYAVERKI